MTDKFPRNHKKKKNTQGTLYTSIHKLSQNQLPEELSISNNKSINISIPHPNQLTNPNKKKV